jgi:hypothetical protein
MGPLVSHPRRLTDRTGRVRMTQVSPISLPHDRSRSTASALPCALLCSLWPVTTKLLPCRPTRPKGVPWHRAPPAPSASQVTAYWSRAAQVSTSPTTSARISSSTTAVWAPLASPPLQEGPLESIVQPCVHTFTVDDLRSEPKPLSASRQQPSPTVLRPQQQFHPSTLLLIDQFPEHLDPTTGSVPSFPHRPSTTAVETPLWWASVHPTATHGSPLVQVSSPAPPSPVSRRQPAEPHQQRGVLNPLLRSRAERPRLGQASPNRLGRAAVDVACLHSAVL